MKLLIYINEQLIKLSPGTLLAYTYQNTFLSDLTTRRVSYSNEITAPECPENDLVFGLARISKSDSAPAYDRLTAKVIRNGTELPLTYCQVMGADEGYKLRFYSGFKQFIDVVGDGTLDQLNELNSGGIVTWDDAFIDSKRNATSGIVAPAVSYGQISRQDLFNEDFTDSSPGADIEDWEQVPDTPDNLSQYTNEEWANNGTYIYAQLDSYAISNASNDFEATGTTVFLRQAYTFYAGQEYEISIRHNFQGGVGDNTYASLAVWNDNTPFGREILNDQSQSAATTTTFTYTPVDGYGNPTNYYQISLQGILLPPTPTGGGATRTADIRVYFITIRVKLQITQIGYFPSVYYKSIFQSIYEKAGYQVENTSIFSDSIYTKLIIPFSKDQFAFTGFFNKCREFKAELNEPVTITADGNVIFETIVQKDLFGFYNPTTGDYDTDGASAYQPVETWDTREFYGKFYAELDITMGAGAVELKIMSQGFGTMATQTITVPGRYTVRLTANMFGEDDLGFLLSGGDVVSVFADVTGTTSFKINSGRFYNTVNGINHRPNDPYFHVCEILPEMKQADFIKDMFVRFAIIPFEKNRELVLKTLEEILSDRNGALDWTAKRNISFKEKITYSTNYTQNNYFNYPASDQLFDNFFTQGNIQVDNENLEDESVMFESPFNGSVDIGANFISSTSLYFGYIPLNDSAKIDFPTPGGEEIDNDTGLRLMVVRDPVSGDATAYYDGNARTDYLVANFTRPNAQECAFEAFLERFYRRARRAIQMDKIIVRMYNLTDVDISQVHPHKMIYDNGEYFILEEVSQHVGGKTLCRLYKIS